MSVLDTEIMNFEGNSWMTRDAATGLICFGMTGSGKSSGPLRSIAMRFLELGYGGIVFVLSLMSVIPGLDMQKNRDVIKILFF